MAPPALVLDNRYRLDERIAVGGMGEVWRAEDLLLSRPVAVKLLRPAYAQDDSGLTRFRAEARYAGSLSHPNIAQIYDYGGGEPPDRPYLVMELVDGPSLAGLLADGPLDVTRTLEIIGQASAGLAAAHAAGLVHRDVKPGNLLVSKTGLVKIADFGIAHAVGSAPVTRTGELIGTPAYLSPEQVMGAHATPASDLYALGIVTYQCLTGEVPFTGEPLAVALAHQERRLPPLPPSVPLGVAALVAALTAKDPRSRPASAGHVTQRAEHLRARLGAGAGSGRAAVIRTRDVAAAPVPLIAVDPPTAVDLPTAADLPAAAAGTAAAGTAGTGTAGDAMSGAAGAPGGAAAGNPGGAAAAVPVEAAKVPADAAGAGAAAADLVAADAGEAAHLPGDAVGVPGGAVGVPGGTIGVPGGAVGVPGGTVGAGAVAASAGDAADAPATAASALALPADGLAVDGLPAEEIPAAGGAAADAPWPGVAAGAALTDDALTGDVPTGDALTGDAPAWPTPAATAAGQRRRRFPGVWALLPPARLPRRAGLAIAGIAGIAVFGLAGWAVSILPGAPAHQRNPRPPVARPSGPVLAPGAPVSTPGPQTVATPGATSHRSHAPRPSASASPSAPVTPTPTPPPPTPSGQPSPSSSPSASPSVSPTGAPSPAPS